MDYSTIFVNEIKAFLKSEMSLNFSWHIKNSKPFFYNLHKPMYLVELSEHATAYLHVIFLNMYVYSYLSFSTLQKTKNGENNENLDN